MAKRQSTMQMFFKKADRASATEYAVDEKKFFTSDGISASGEDVLEDAIPAIQSDENTSNNQQIDMCKIAFYSERSQLSAEQKFHILTNRDTLPHNFQVPGRLEKLGCQRHFPAKWLQHYSWLEYSVMANGGFCVPCMLFGIRSDHADLGVLLSRPLTNFKKATNELNAHDKKASYLDAVTSVDLFLKVMSGKQPPVHQQANIALANRMAANKIRLVPIAKTILLCGRQTFALRGHDHSIKTIKAQLTSNSGNFKALLQFRVNAGEKDLELHMKTAPKNATCCSATIQNEIIDVTCTLIRKHIIERVKKCRFYSVIADKVTDAANREQLSLVIRYFDPKSKTAAERLLHFSACHLGVTGHAIAETTSDLLQKNHLDPKRLRGQGYDGASNMAEKVKGAAAIITSKHPLALYFHCAYHQLNLGVMKSMELISVRN